MMGEGLPTTDSKIETGACAKMRMDDGGDLFGAGDLRGCMEIYQQRVASSRLRFKETHTRPYRTRYPPRQDARRQQADIETEQTER